tara:strand:- start:4149 stop:4892 length:744 start_codon:yes stop_codon:yes gene_type:complete
MQLHEISEHNTKIWVSGHVSSDFQMDWFEQEELFEESAIHEWKSGRQSTLRINTGSRKMILRHYCRGGFPARFSEDKFVFRGFEATRPFRELALLHRMRGLGLPVPEPIASRCILKGFLYQADILMGEIVNSKTLAQIISANRLGQETWSKIGETIWYFHQQGIQHVDLNANNILLDQAGDIYLIDFDRCTQRAYSHTWAVAGLQRLKRSLNKQKINNAKTNFHQKDFEWLMKGYEDCSSISLNTRS